MINPIKNKKTKRIIGLRIDGKDYHLPKDVCHAIGLEEKRFQSKSLEFQDSARSVFKKLGSSLFHVKTRNLDVHLKFTSKNEIDEFNLKLKFIEKLGNLSTGQKKLIHDAIFEFIMCHNQALKEYQRILENELQQDKAA
jgi:hypothetical protein